MLLFRPTVTKKRAFISLTRHGSRFFRPNKYPASPSKSIPGTTTDSKIPEFVPSSWTRYHELVKSSDSYINPKLMKKLDLKNRLGRPSIGSLIELKSDNSDDVELGIVISDEGFLFKRNVYQVLTMSSEVKLVHNNEIRFSLNEFLNVPEMFQLINDGKHEPLIQFMKSFVKTSQEVISKNYHLLAMIQSWYSKKFTPQTIDLVEVTSLMKEHIKGRRIVTESLMMGLYLYFQNDPYNFTVISLNDFSTNLETNTMGTQVKILSNPIYEAELLEHAQMLSNEVRLEFNSYLLSFLKGEETLLDDFLRDPNVQGYKDFQSIIILMKQFIKNPHPLLKEQLEMITDDVVPEVSAKEIYKLLNNLSILTESSQIFNHPKLLPVSLLPLISSDRSKHLRSSHDILTFGFPSLKLSQKLDSQDYADLAISLDTTSTEQWELSIHIPDVASVFQKDDPIIGSILERVSDISLPNDSQSLFSRETLKSMAFSEGGENRALTVTLTYDLDPSKRWKDIKRIQVKLTNLKNFKMIPLDELNEIWKLRKPNLGNFLQILFPGMIEDGNKKLKRSEKDILNKFFTMIDYWYFKRNEVGSMEYQFPKTMVKVDPMTGDLIEVKHGDEYSYLDYIMKEIDLIVSHHILKYSKDKEIPLLIKSQELVDFKINDSIEIQSSEFMIPDYETSNFENLVFNKDENGLTPLQNYIVASQFLKPVETSTTPTKFASLGLDGYIGLTSPLSKFEDVVNQWQLLNDVHSRFVENVWIEDKLGDWDLDVLYPKDIEMMDSQELLRYYEVKLKPSQEYIKVLELYQRRFLILLKLHQEIERHTGLNWNIYRCIILKSSSPASKESKTFFPQFTKAYCFDLGIQVIIEHSSDETYLIGDQIICSEIRHLDPYKFQIVLKI